MSTFNVNSKNRVSQLTFSRPLLEHVSIYDLYISLELKKIPKFGILYNKIIIVGDSDTYTLVQEKITILKYLLIAYINSKSCNNILLCYPSLSPISYSVWYNYIIWDYFNRIMISFASSFMNEIQLIQLLSPIAVIWV